MNCLHKLPSGTPEELKVFAVNTLDSFFRDYDLSECHQLLWQLMRQAFVKKYTTLSTREQQNLISFYENLHEMIIASNILYADRVGQFNIQAESHQAASHL